MRQDIDDTDDRLSGIFSGPATTRLLMPVLRAIPAAPASGVLAALAIGHGVAGSTRFVRAFRWAGAQGFTGWPRWQLAFTLLANHGRFVAQEALLGTTSLAQLRAVTRVVGAEHLEQLRGGCLLLGAHVGPPRGWLMLRAHGYPVRFAIRERAGEGLGWETWREREVVVPLSLDDAASRVQSLYRLRRLLVEGHAVFMTADGPLGNPVFQLDLPGHAAVIRSGWFTLRRQLKVPTLPMLVHEDEEGRRIVTIHPPLPAVDEDAGRDGEACREVLTSLLRQYVRQYPAQCRYLAFPPWE